MNLTSALPSEICKLKLLGKKNEYITECYHVFIDGYRRDGRKENCSLIFNSGLEDCVDE